MGVVFRRKKEESVILDTRDGIIEIKVIGGTNTRLNITAPKSVAIWRKELLDDDYKLLSKCRSGITKGSLEEGRNIRVQGCKSFHTPHNSAVHQA